MDRRSGLSVAQFREQYEIPNKPVILTDVVSLLRCCGAVVVVVLLLLVVSPLLAAVTACRQRWW